MSRRAEESEIVALHWLVLSRVPWSTIQRRTARRVCKMSKVSNSVHDSWKRNCCPESGKFWSAYNFHNFHNFRGLFDSPAYYAYTALTAGRICVNNYRIPRRCSIEALFPRDPSDRGLISCTFISFMEHCSWEYKAVIYFKVVFPVFFRTNFLRRPDVDIFHILPRHVGILERVICHGKFQEMNRDGLKAVLSRQRQRSSRGREVEAEAKQGSNVLNRGEARQRQRARGRGEAD